MVGGTGAFKVTNCHILSLILNPLKLTIVTV